MKYKIILSTNTINIKIIEKNLILYKNLGIHFFYNRDKVMDYMEK